MLALIDHRRSTLTHAGLRELVAYEFLLHSEDPIVRVCAGLALRVNRVDLRPGELAGCAMVEFSLPEHLADLVDFLEAPPVHAHTASPTVWANIVEARRGRAVDLSTVAGVSPECIAESLKHWLDGFAEEALSQAMEYSVEAARASGRDTLSEFAAEVLAKFDRKVDR